MQMSELTQVHIASRDLVDELLSAVGTPPLDEMLGAGRRTDLHEGDARSSVSLLNVERLPQPCEQCVCRVSAELDHFRPRPAPPCPDDGA